jgi:alkylation response protein AidB-like acyl-CoA dehydrogenase
MPSTPAGDGTSPLAADRLRLAVSERAQRAADKVNAAAEQVQETFASAQASAREQFAQFADFLAGYRERLAHVFDQRVDLDRLNQTRGIPAFALDALRQDRAAPGLSANADPLSVYIPTQYGGRGGHIEEGLAMLEATGYESLPLSLMMGINGALFLQPLAKYGQEPAKREVLGRFLQGRRMGGLMITEPGFGTDALKMETSFEEHDTHYRLEGTKHWAGLTGWADYWMLTAREQTDRGLGRDVGFFVCDVSQPGQHVEVEEVYPNLGLRMLPYGRNKIDVRVPKTFRLEPHSSGVKMMLDVLHRSRLQFPGMGMGFLRRMLDEAIAHTQSRSAGGRPLIALDQVRARIARIQAACTATAAMCAFSSERASTENDCAGDQIPANAIKATVTDWMQSAAQSLVQLMGAQGYRSDSIAGRALVDSRPFQIFEGSNDVLYAQVAEAVLKGMRKMKQADLGTYLAADEHFSRAAERLKGLLDIDVDLQMPQRKLVALGEALSNLFSIDVTLRFGDAGFRADLVEQAVETLKEDVRAMLETVRHGSLADVIEDVAPAGAWLPMASR